MSLRALACSYIQHNMGLASYVSMRRQYNARRMGSSNAVTCPRLMGSRILLVLPLLRAQADAFHLARPVGQRDLSY